MDDYDTQVVRLGRAGIDQQVDDVTGRIGLVFDLSDDTALYGQYGTGSQHPSDSVVTGSVLNQEADMIESEQARDRPQAPGRRHGIRVDRRVVRYHEEQLDLRRPDLRRSRGRHRGRRADVARHRGRLHVHGFGELPVLRQCVDAEFGDPRRGRGRRSTSRSRRPTSASSGASATPFASSPTLATSAIGSAAFRSRRTRSWTRPCASTSATASGSR